LSEFGPFWSLIDSGRYRDPKRPHQRMPSFHFTLTRVNYIRAIKIEMPVKYLQCSVNVSQILVASPPADWRRESGRERHRPQSSGRPHSEDNGGIDILTKKISFALTLALLRGEPF
jgi:hypothetical protein